MNNFTAFVWDKSSYRPAILRRNVKPASSYRFTSKNTQLDNIKIVQRFDLFFSMNYARLSNAVPAAWAGMVRVSVAATGVCALKVITSIAASACVSL